MGQSLEMNDSSTLNGWGALVIIWVDEEGSGDDWLIEMASAGDLVADFVG